MAIARFAVPALVAGLVVLGSAQTACADGMKPEKSIVIVSTDPKHPTVMNVTNTGGTEDMLLVDVLPIDEDTADIVVVSPASATARVKPNGTQQVTFTAIEGVQDSSQQRLRRVVFEGAKGTPKRAQKRNEVGVSVRQNLPLIIHPKGLPLEREPWKFLKWTRSGDDLKVENNSPYVVRLSQEFESLPSNTVLGLSNSYVRPNTALIVQVPAGAKNDTRVRIHPATVYGFQTDHFEAPITGEK
ncbi:fimbria/pilus chaperone family protein [Stenotrophomonas sp. VV52]|uniref:fimbria/pilus chaperone family protein n=1 Tax=Stenotrophomonas sp. VV52 TaxID=2066958 RepID=UPI000C9E1175|nr:fimbria/pilus chaperone family protein [Stenotrophomonas sp. VV52]